MQNHRSKISLANPQFHIPDANHRNSPSITTIYFAEKAFPHADVPFLIFPFVLPCVDPSDFEKIAGVPAQN
jgi:hypothetical protein